MRCTVGAARRTHDSVFFFLRVVRYPISPERNATGDENVTGDF